MSTDLNTQLRAFAEELAADLPTIDADELLGTQEPVRSLSPHVRPHRSLTPSMGGRRPWLVAAAAGVFVLLLAAPIFLFGEADTDAGGTADDVVTPAPVTPAPVTPATGLPGLPPPGAVPSDPVEGELVASMWEHHGAPGDFGNGWIYIYADGRVIWATDSEPTGGWLEQRLTRTGVELIRSEMLATGLFEEDQPAVRPNAPSQRFVFGTIQVRNGDRLVYVGRSVADLFERLATMWEWLPDDAWVDEQANPFVPSGYAACVHKDGYVEPVDPSDPVSLLPASAQELLGAAPVLRLADLVNVDPGGFAWLEGSGEDCFVLTTDEARLLAAALDDAGIEEFPQRSYDFSDVGYPIADGEIADPGGIGSSEVTLGIWPMLPHGVPAFTGA
jgi:hypothetical protein